jgi:hypothetical protein
VVVGHGGLISVRSANGFAKLKKRESKQDTPDDDERNELRPHQREYGATKQPACASRTKCVVGATSMTSWTIWGMLSRGVIHRTAFPAA